MRTLEPDPVKPLPIPVSPHPGEALLSLLVRATEANFVDRVEHLVEAANAQSAVVGFLPFTGADLDQNLSVLLGVGLDEVTARFHGPAAAGADLVEFHGMALERRLLEARVQRVSPGALRASEHHRGEWLVRPLTFCPQSMELLVDRCAVCNGTLGWTGCRATWRCNRCGASLKDQEAAFVPDALHEEARLAAALFSTSPAEREAARAAVPKPFCSWAAGDLAAAVVEFGSAVSTPISQKNVYNKRYAKGDFRSFDAADLVAGLKFIREWPTPLTQYVRSTYAATGSTSMRVCFGYFGKCFMSQTRKSVLSDFIRDEAAQILHDAEVPVRVHWGAVDRGARTETVSALDAERLLGIHRKYLRRLEGKSTAFVVRQPGKGGTVLYRRSELERMVTVLAESVPTRAAARSLGVAAPVIEALADAGLLTRVVDPEALILTDEPRRVTSASVEKLEIQLIGLLPGSRSHGGIRISELLVGHGDVRAWSRTVEGLLDGRIVVVGRTDDQGPALTRILVRPDRPNGDEAMTLPEPTGVSSCLSVARLLGSSSQFVSAAVEAGLIEGERGVRNSRVSLASAKRFAERFILPSEVRFRLGCSKMQVRWRMAGLGLKPKHTIYRVSVWDRPEFEAALRAGG